MPQCRLHLLKLLNTTGISYPQVRFNMENKILMSLNTSWKGTIGEGYCPHILVLGFLYAYGLHRPLAWSDKAPLLFLWLQEGRSQFKTGNFCSPPNVVGLQIPSVPASKANHQGGWESNNKTLGNILTTKVYLTIATRPPVITRW